jgi:predicted hydrocarbon binding protein
VGVEWESTRDKAMVVIVKNSRPCCCINNVQHVLCCFSFQFLLTKLITWKGKKGL